MISNHLFSDSICFYLRSQVPQSVVSWLQRKYHASSFLSPTTAAAAANTTTGLQSSTDAPGGTAEEPPAMTPAEEEQLAKDKEIENDCERISVCFILMLDSLLKQVEFWFVNLHWRILFKVK